MSSSPENKAKNLPLAEGNGNGDYTQQSGHVLEDPHNPDKQSVFSEDQDEGVTRIEALRESASVQPCTARSPC